MFTVTPLYPDFQVITKQSPKDSFANKDPNYTTFADKPQQPTFAKISDQSTFSKDSRVTFK